MAVKLSRLKLSKTVCALVKGLFINGMQRALSMNLACNVHQSVHNFLNVCINCFAVV